MKKPGFFKKPGFWRIVRKTECTRAAEKLKLGTNCRINRPMSRLALGAVAADRRIENRCKLCDRYTTCDDARPAA